MPPVLKLPKLQDCEMGWPFRSDEPRGSTHLHDAAVEEMLPWLKHCVLCEGDTVARGGDFLAAWRDNCGASISSAESRQGAHLLAESVSIYRQKKASRTLVLDVSPTSKLPRGFAIAGGCFLVATLVFGLLTTCWVHSEPDDPTCVTPPGVDASPCAIRRYDESILSLAPGKTWLAMTGQSAGYVKYLGGAEVPGLLLFLAFASVVAPRLTRERATLTLDEREDRLSLRRLRFGELQETVRPLRELSDAVVVRYGNGTAAQLVFANGEKMDLGRPSQDAPHTDQVIAAVNRFMFRGA
jgi:hypothetical protein